MALLAACGSKATSEASASASGSESASAAASESATASPSASASASASPSASASASATATNSPLPNDNKDYSGVAKLEKMEDHGEYQPGNAEHPPQNVPSPIVPEAMHQNSVAGFAAALAYFGAAFEYPAAYRRYALHERGQHRPGDPGGDEEVRGLHQGRY